MATQLLKCNASSPFFATPKHAPPRLSRHQCRATLNDDKVLGIGLLDKAYVGRRTLLLSGSATVAGLTVAPRPVTAGANKAKEDSGEKDMRTSDIVHRPQQLARVVSGASVTNCGKGRKHASYALRPCVSPHSFRVYSCYARPTS